VPSLPLGSGDLPYAVQLQGRHGECWGAEFGSATVLRNDDSQFKAVLAP
jgi:hypothetical protein